MGKNVKFTINDLLDTKTQDEILTFKELHDYAINKKLKLETHNQYRRYRYSYKKEYVLVLDPYIAVQYNNQYSRKRNSWDSFELFLKIIEKQPDKDKLIKFIQKDICICHSCSNRKIGPKKDDECCGHWLDIYGVRRKAASCHPEISRCHLEKEFQKYSNLDIKMLKRMIDIRILQIDMYE
jgi:hypothetical protein